MESEGLTIGGWVLEPKDYDPSKTYPAVFDVHGGPKTVYGPVFYHEMQLWANMGYFVFFCNPKGSDGRDNDFMDIFGHYGETDYHNLMDFADAVLTAYPQIDPKRVCLTGGSYGGFMTNWIIGHTDRFCCAASQRSISNWLSFYGVSDIGPVPRGRLHPGGAGDLPAAAPPLLRRERDDAHALHPLRRGLPLSHGGGAADVHGPGGSGRARPALPLPRGEPRALPLRQAQAPGPAAAGDHGLV